MIIWRFLALRIQFSKHQCNQQCNTQPFNKLVPIYCITTTDNAIINTLIRTGKGKGLSILGKQHNVDKPILVSANFRFMPILVLANNITMRQYLFMQLPISFSGETIPVVCIMFVSIVRRYRKEHL